MKPGDSLVSTISMPKGLVLLAQLRNAIERGVEDSSPVRTAAVLTCVGQPQPPDAFRPAFCHREQKIYRSRNLKRELLPTAAPTPSIPKLEQKEPLLVNYVQAGIDLGGMVRAGHPGWTGYGGHGSGRKLPIVFAGLLLGDDQLANINRSYPKVSFGEDEQTAYGESWAGVTGGFNGHSGIDEATGVGRSRGNGWGPYEHTPPAQWTRGQNTSESYRRCCSNLAWVAQALSLRLMHAEKAWNHDAFFDYVDRWMYEPDARKGSRDEWQRQGQAWDAFVNEMWAKHRPKLPAPSDGWKQPHDFTYYRQALEKMQTQDPAKPRP